MFSFKKSLQKMMMWSENVCGESYTFDIEKSLAFAICKECVVKAFGVAIMSSCSIPFLKIVFTHYFT
jgi:hypothetical protein